MIIGFSKLISSFDYLIRKISEKENYKVRGQSMNQLKQLIWKKKQFFEKFTFFGSIGSPQC